MAECFDYLFEIAVKMKLAGLDPARAPAGWRDADQSEKFTSQDAGR